MKTTCYAMILLLTSLALPLTAAADSQPAQPATAQANAAVLQQLDFTDRQAFEAARRGFIAAPPDDPLLNPDGSIAWNMGAYAFLAEEAPDTVNPSL